jgi:hypothetical protein
MLPQPVITGKETKKSPWKLLKAQIKLGLTGLFGMPSAWRTVMELASGPLSKDVTSLASLLPSPFRTELFSPLMKGQIIFISFSFIFI